MAAYGTMQVQTSTGNPLCDKLKRQYADRGAAKAVRKTAPSTSVMIKRVQNGLDPYENAPNPLTEKRTVTAAQMQRRQMAESAKAPAARRPVQQGAQPKSASAKPRTASPAAARPAAQKPAVRSVADTRMESRRSRSAAAAARTAKAETPVTEVRVARAPFPFTAVMMLSIFTLMVMVLVYSFAQNYELSNEISTLEAQQRILAEQERELSLRLEERNDIRLIEDIAVNEIGMVKGDLVENRFVTVSGGNRVVIATFEDEEPKVQEGIFSTMLSAIGENFAKLKEYID